MSAAATFRFAVDVLPKPGILDPQGRAVEGSLGHLGIAGVSGVRVGRRVELTVAAASEAEARATVERLAGELLANPLIEVYTVESLGVAGGGDGRWRPGAGTARPRPSGRRRSAMTVRIGVVVFPGSNCDTDTEHGLRLAGAEPIELWHEDVDLAGVAAVVLPGGFAYGDYLRAGVIARFSPVMRAVSGFAADGGLVLGVCNGFQVLAEAGLVPGALLRNRELRFLGRDVLHRPGTPRQPVHRRPARSTAAAAAHRPR